MGSCSIKDRNESEIGIKVVSYHQTTPSVENELKQTSKRVTKSKQKAALLEIRKGSIPVLDAPTAQVREMSKTSKDLDLIEKSFQRHFIFNTLPNDYKKIIINSMKHYSLGPKQMIFRQGQPGNNFFVVASGILEVLVNEARINTITEGMGFGELALMHDTPRTATVNTLTPTSLWGLDRNTFKKIIEELNVLNYQENKSFIESVSVFSILKPTQIDALVGSVHTLNFLPGQVIVKEGDAGNLLFIIKDGLVSCTRQNLEIKKFGKGEYFGEQALLYKSMRTATCTAISNVKCLSIDSDSLNTALGEQLQSIIFKNSQSIIIEKHPILNKLSLYQAENLIKGMQIKTFKSGDIVVEKFTQKKKFLVMVLKGKINVEGVEIEKLNCVGIDGIINNSDEVYGDNIFCMEETDLALIEKESFEKSIGGDYFIVTNNNEAFKVLKKVQILRDLKDETLTALIEAMKIEKYNEGDIIVQQNHPGSSLYIVKSGKVSVKIDGHEVRTITKHDYFGERSVIFNQTRTATVIASENVECWVLFQIDFLRIVNENLRNQLIKRIELQDDDITLEDLKIIKVLGKGMFGNVFLAIHKHKRLFYAVKTVDRKKINAYELHESLILERKILLQLDHIFIMKLIKTMKDPKRVYFLLEYVRGMDLFDVIRKMNTVTQEDSQFFVACLIVILQHLHERDIIYRDLKPENVVVDEEGYLKLIDFGTAKIVNGRTYTIVGTPHYMAPEVILRKGYSVAVDYWSLGIVLYELLFERVPFADNEEDPLSIYEIILTAKVKYPKIQGDLNLVKSFINQLLNRNPSLRLAGGFEKLKAHPWLKVIDWEMLLSKRIKPPFVPHCKFIDVNRVLSKSSGNNIDNIISAEENSEIQVPHTKAPHKWDSEF